jgi:ribosomal protein S27AE
MATLIQTQQLIATDEQQDFDLELDDDAIIIDEPVAFAHSDEVHADPEEIADAPECCPMCGELLAWHDEFSSACGRVPAQPVFETKRRVVETEDVSQDADNQEAFAKPYPPRERTPSGLTFAYGVGHLVKPISLAQPHAVIWRGQLKERHPATGLVHRVNVYRLDNNFWDCYYEEELLAA